MFLIPTQVLGTTGEVCEATRQPDVNYFDVRIPVTAVPDRVTHYLCQIFKVPDDETYHAVAFEPLIGENNIVHHMLLFACDFEPDSLDPHECSNADNMCRSWLTQLSLGVKGQICTDKNAGVRFGKNSHGYVALQIHWNNAKRLENITDDSGIRIFYTKHLRQHDVGNVQIGQNDLEIPPMSVNVTQQGGCSDICTGLMLPHPIYLTRTHIHMHNLGVRGALEIFRNGKMIKTIAKDDVYTYDPSPVHVHDVPIEVEPGDEVRLTCWFDTQTGEKKRNKTIYWGKGSDGEMCYAFVTYYPKVEGFDQCIQFSSYDMNCPTREKPSFGGCDLRSFQQLLVSYLLPQIQQRCNGVDVRDVSACDSKCFKTLRILSSQPCMKDRIGAYVRREMLPSVPGWDKVQPHFTSFLLNC